MVSTLTDPFRSTVSLSSSSKVENHAQRLPTNRPGLGRRQCRTGRVVQGQGAQDGSRGFADEGDGQARDREEVSRTLLLLSQPERLYWGVWRRDGDESGHR